MTTRSARLLQNITVSTDIEMRAPQQSQVVSSSQASTRNGGALSTKNRQRARAPPAAPVALKPEERELAELEAATLYYKGLIELKLKQGIEVTDDDPTILKLEAAVNDYQRYLMPRLSV